MKKLMIALAVAAFAVASQAATITWGNNTSTKVLGLNGAALTSNNAKTVANGGYDIVASLYAVHAGTDVLLKSVGFSGQTGASAISTMTAGVLQGASASYTYGSPVENGDELYVKLTMTVDSKQYEMVIDDQGWVVTQSSNADPAATISWATTKTYGGASGDYKWVQVPEPTSGLLMLVGLGALALRRRRA